MNNDISSILDAAGVKPTPNRILVFRTLHSAASPMSLVELETSLGTLERSSILRVLRLLHEHSLIHTLEDGRGIGKYELCHGKGHCSPGDMHAHFYCERCERVFCFEHISAPEIPLPKGFSVSSVNFMLKGICPDCRTSHI